jgi:hypothetical protein
MLSHIDVHHLAAILTQIGSEWGVEIELGEMVADVIAEKDRDVDITVRYRDADGTLKELHGIEVKDEGRPLGVQPVEQIILKLGDMPSLTKHALVSSSGYSDGAWKKAKHYGLELYHFRDWDGKGLQVDLSQLKFMDSASQGWETVEAIPVVDGPPPADQQQQHNVSLDIMVNDPYSSGNSRPLFEVMNLICKDALEKVATQVNANPDLVNDDRFNVDMPLLLPNPIIITLPGSPLTICSAQVRGTAIIKRQRVQTVLKALYLDGKELPIAGCAVAELPDKSLWVMMASSREGSLTARIISVTDRGKNKIYQQKLGTIPMTGPESLQSSPA